MGFYCFQLKIIKTHTSDDTAAGAYSLGHTEGPRGPISGIRGGWAWLQPAGRVDWDRQVGGVQWRHFRKKEVQRELSVSGEALGPSGRWGPPALKIIKTYTMNCR